MGALAPISCWIPEDDLVLKKAVEDGASLEALAKGAVRFSRRFTIQELQNRWHALLYDPDVSGTASALMVELELAASNLSSQSNKVGGSKGNGNLGKRKDGSVHSHYYAMRKRIRSEPFSSVDLNFFGAPTLLNCQDQVTIHNESVGNCMIGDPVLDHFDLHDTNFDIVSHGFPQAAKVGNAAGNDEAATHAYHTGHQNTLQGEISDGIIGGNSLYEFGKNVPHGLGNEVIANNIPHSFEHDNMHENINVHEEKFSVYENISNVQKMGSPQVLPGENLFEIANLTTKSLCEFNLVSKNPAPNCCGFGQSQGFCSPIIDSSVKFHQLEYSSPDPTMPIWRTLEEMSTPSNLNNENLVDKDKNTGAEMLCPVADNKHVSSSGYDTCHPALQLEERMSDELKKSSAMSEGSFFDLSNSLEDFLLMDVDGKDMIDRSCLDGLSSILLSSPNDIHRDDISSFTDPKSSVAMDAYPVIPDVACSVDYGVVSDKLQSSYKNFGPNSSLPSSTLAPHPHSPECFNGVICCTLNTVDPDIPCNDDVIFPTEVQPPSGSCILQHNSEEHGRLFSPSTINFSVSQVASEQGLNQAKEEELPTTSRMMEPQFLLEMSSENPVTCRIKSGLPESLSLETASRHIGIAGGELSQCGSAHLTPYPISTGESTEDVTKAELGKHCKFDSSIDFLLESSIHCSDDNGNHPQKKVGEYKHEPDVPGAIQDHLAPEHGYFEMPFSEPGANHSIPDQEMQLSEDDNDVAHFSDVEALILDMNLIPCDDDSYYNKEVSSYQLEEAKRAILRLEQGTHSYMQRAMSCHRAFAILYGRHLKHYIRKDEVSLGRATDDVSVDIDLAKEGRANKISRRQAIIKLEKDGSFSLKNIGKGSIVVNGKEVASGHCIKLCSGCLIEIRSMNFIFETNKKVTKQYLASIAKNYNKGSMYGWSPEEIS